MLYKIIDSTSNSCSSSALNMFHTKPTNVTINSSLYSEILPSNSLDNPPYHFHISANDGYLDLSKTYLQVEFKLVKENAAKTGFRTLLESDVVSVNQSLGSTFCRNIKLSINNREVFNANSLYAYKSLIDMELSHTKEAKDSYLQVAGYRSDDRGPEDQTGSGFLARKKMFVENKTVQFLSKLYIDIFNQDLYLLNNCELDLEITPNSQAFNLFNGDAGNYRLTLESCKLYVKSLFLMDGLNLELAAKLETEPCRYSINKTDLKVFMITAGRLQFNVNAFQEQVPRRMVVCFTDYSSYVGSETSSPFVLNHHSVKDISVQFNGKTFPNPKYELDFKNGKFARAFHDMLENTGMYGNDTNGINLDAYKNRLALFVFNLTNAQEVDNCFDLIKSGVTGITVNFADAVGVGGLAMIVYAEFDGLVILDKNRVLTSDVTI